MPDNASTVWCASAAIDDAGSPWEKFRAIVHRTGFLDRMDDGDNVAIKVHMSELGNIRGIRPLWVRYVADIIREAGGQPFVTDTTTLYRRGRVTLQKYLDTAARHGFSPQTMGCPVIIADGFGNAGTYVTQDAKRYKRVPVAQAIYEADALVNLAHPTLHPSFLQCGQVHRLLGLRQPLPRRGIRARGKGRTLQRGRLHRLRRVHRGLPRRRTQSPLGRRQRRDTALDHRGDPRDALNIRRWQGRPPRDRHRLHRRL